VAAKEMVSREKANATMKRLAETTWSSYEAPFDYMVAQQERNVRFAQGVFETFGREYRERIDTNLAMTQELFERAENQHYALRAVFEKSLNAWIKLLYAPFSY
jgi:hypothetical protein